MKVFFGTKVEMNFNLVCLFQKIKSHKVDGETSKTLPDPYEGKWQEKIPRRPSNIPLSQAPATELSFITDCIIIDCLTRLSIKKGQSHPPGLSHVPKLHFQHAAAVIEDPPLSQVAWKTQGGCNFHKKSLQISTFPSWIWGFYSW